MRLDVIGCFPLHLPFAVQICTCRLLMFFIYTLNLCWQVVIFRDGKYMTLKEVFESLDLTGYASYCSANFSYVFWFLVPEAMDVHIHVLFMCACCLNTGD